MKKELDSNLSVDANSVSEMIKWVEVDQLSVGMYVTRVKEGWGGDTNLKAEGLITRADTIQRFKAMGVSHVFIDVDKGSDSPLAVEYNPNDPAPVVPNKEPTLIQTAELETDLETDSGTSFEDEFDNAMDVRSRAMSLAQDLLNNAKMGHSFERDQVDHIASEISQSLTQNPNALLSLMRLRKKDDYLLEHSLNVAVLMGVLSSSLGITGELHHDLVLGAFVHDIGKIKVPENILHKAGSFEEHEWPVMRKHVEFGIEILQGVEGMPQVAMDICAQHHERLDGRGYPNALNAEQISHHGRMASVVDVYDAITAERVYSTGVEPTLALKRMLSWGGTHLDKELIYQLIRCISVYPAGAMVQLQSGHIGFVQEVNLKQPSRPIVRLIFDSKRNIKIDERKIDLSYTDLYGQVTTAIDPDDYSLDLHDYLT